MAMSMSSLETFSLVSQSIKMYPLMRLNVLIVEMNLAQNAEAMANGTHPGYESTAVEGLSLSLEVMSQKGIKVIINGGSLNPAGLAAKVQEMVCESKHLLSPYSFM
jgi:hypothetical protein